MILKYANKQTKRRPFMTILILFQFAAITVLISLIISKLQTYFLTSNLIKDVCTQNSYKIEYDISYSVEKSDRSFEIRDKQEEETETYVNKLENGEITQEEYDKIISKINSKYEKIIEKENLNECNNPINLSQLPYVQKKYILYDSMQFFNNDLSLYLLSKDYCNDMKFKMQEGCWFSEAKQSDDYINVVTFSGNGYKVGDVFDISLNKAFSDINTVEPTNNLKGKIVGLIDYYYYRQLIEHGTTETNKFVSLDDFLPLAGSDVIFAEYSNNFLEKIPASNKKCIEQCTSVVQLKDNITETEKKEFFSVATSKKYQCTNLNKAYQNTYIRDKKEFQNDMIFLIIASLIAIISLVGMSALSVSKEIKTYSIYCLNGMTRKQCIKINTIYICLLVLMSSIIAFIIEFIYGFINYYKTYTNISILRSEAVAKESVLFSRFFSIGATEISAVIILLFISVISAMIIPYLTLNKLDIIQNIKEDG